MSREECEGPALAGPSTVELKPDAYLTLTIVEPIVPGFP
jgi:hypothetical protein